MNIKTLEFPNVGVISGIFSEQDLIPIKNEILEIQSNFDAAKKHNYQLVGNIKKEFVLTKSKEYLNKLLEPIIWEFNESFSYLRNLAFLDKDCLLTLDSAWVNFQEKYEFNPTHSHSGVLSFVIWIKIPYDIADEKSMAPGSESRNPLAGHFTFHYTNVLGKICQQDVAADSSMENHFFLFPAELNHSVSPFFTSDEYRISVSGNFKFQIPQDNKNE